MRYHYLYVNTSFELIILSLSAISLFITSLDMAIVNLAIPFIAKYYSLTPQHASLVLSAYYLALALIMLIGGYISDVAGTLKILSYGCILFLVGTLAAGLAPEFNLLIAARFIQGIGGALLLPIHGTMIRKYLPTNHFGKYFGIMTFVAGLAFALGYSIGGFLLIISWRLIFLINLPFTLVILILITRLKHNSHIKTYQTTHQDDTHMDTHLNPLKQLKKINLHHLSSSAFNNLINPKLWQLNRTLILAIVSVFIVNVVFDGFNLINPYYLNNIRHIPPTQIGMLLTILPLSAMLIGPFAGGACDKYGAKNSALFSIILLASAIIILTTCNLTTNFLLIGIALSIFGAAIAIFFTANMHLVMLNSPPQYAGTISALKSSIAYFGGVLGFSLYARLITSNAQLNSHNLGTSFANTVHLLAGFHTACKLSIILTLILFVLGIMQKKCNKPYISHFLQKSSSQ